MAEKMVKLSRIKKGIDKSAPAKLLPMPPMPEEHRLKSKARVIASYNWIRTENGIPAIAVPGKNRKAFRSLDYGAADHYTGHPPEWTPNVPIPSPKLPSDDEARSQDEAIARHPYAFEPLLASIDICQSYHDFSDFQIVTELRNLEEPISFTSKKKSSFRIDVEVIGKTVLFLIALKETRILRMTRAPSHGLTSFTITRQHIAPIFSTRRQAAIIEF